MSGIRSVYARVGGAREGRCSRKSALQSFGTKETLIFGPLTATVIRASTASRINVVLTRHRLQSSAPRNCSVSDASVGCSGALGVTAACNIGCTMRCTKRNSTRIPFRFFTPSLLHTSMRRSTPVVKVAGPGWSSQATPSGYSTARLRTSRTCPEEPCLSWVNPIACSNSCVTLRYIFPVLWIKRAQE